MRLTIATFNIRHAHTVAGAVDPARTARAIVRTGAGFVALQEVDRNMKRSGRIDQPAELERLTGLRVRFWPTLERGGGAYGIAIASDDESKATFYPLPRSGAEEPRAAIVAVWRGLTIIATHLSRHPEARAAQIVVLGELASKADGPVVIAGDLNEQRDGLAPLLAAGLAAPERLRPTLPSVRPRRQIDHILAGRGAVIARTRVPRTLASDHRPLVAEIEVPERPL